MKIIALFGLILDGMCFFAGATVAAVAHIGVLLIIIVLLPPCLIYNLINGNSKTCNVGERKRLIPAN